MNNYSYWAERGVYYYPPEDENTWGGNRLAVERAEVAKRGLPALADDEDTFN